VEVAWGNTAGGERRGFWGAALSCFIESAEKTTCLLIVRDEEVSQCVNRSASHLTSVKGEKDGVEWTGEESTRDMGVSIYCLTL